MAPNKAGRPYIRKDTVLLIGQPPETRQKAEHERPSDLQSHVVEQPAPLALLPFSDPAQDT